MKTLLICQSIHHGNTLRIAEIIAGKLGAKIKKPSEIESEELDEYELVGFGSGIYDDMHHKSLLDFVDESPKIIHKKTFIFSTSGVPVAILGNKFLENYMSKAHGVLKKRLEAKNCKILGEFICPGFNTNVFLKYFGGLNKKRPDQKDFEKAREFSLKIKKAFLTF